MRFISVILFCVFWLNTTPLWASPPVGTDGCRAFSDEISSQQLAAIVPMLASANMRSYHNDWHQLRGIWQTLTPAEQQQYLSEGWSAPGAMNLLADASDSNLETDVSVAGEDFLFMHRSMIEMVRALLVKQGLPCIAGWNPIPYDLQGHTGGAVLWPVPTEQLQSYLQTEEGRQQTLDQIKAWEKQYEDPAWLRGHSLSYVGETIERTIHGSMHDLWSGMPPCLGKALPALDAPECNWLDDNYEAAVNPHFWKLHGWIDDRIDQWLKINGYRSISTDCHDDPTCYQWKGTWLGRSMM